ncbi:MAG: methyltransferase domain-containing protein [Victivallaceae bacterium]|nr:methyltransferase domain-containing protein [Victivallaceae bacterium]
MGNFKVFAEHAKRYDEWYDNERNYDRYIAELTAIREMMPASSRKLEVGVGSGRFAAPLGIEHGIDPVDEMLVIAKSRGVKTVKGVAENLPYDNSYFDYVLMTTTLCFLDDVTAALTEVKRVLSFGGTFTVAFVDKNSVIGKRYQQRVDSKFYKNATFYAVEEVIALLNSSGFEMTTIMQTLLCKSNKCHFDLRVGYGEGAFVVINSQLA